MVSGFGEPGWKRKAKRVTWTTPRRCWDWREVKISMAMTQDCWGCRISGMCTYIYIYTIMHYHVWHIYIYIYWYYNIYIDVLKACFFQTHIFFWGILQILWGESWVYFGMLSNQYLGITSQNEDHNGCSPYIYIYTFHSSKIQSDAPNYKLVYAPVTIVYSYL